MRFTALPLALAVASLLLAAGGRLAAQDVPPAPEKKIVLANGDTFTGVLVSEDDQYLVIKHPTLGLLKVPKVSLAPPPAIIDVKVPEQAPPPSPWSGSLDMGVSGASGNTNNENFRTMFKATHKTETRVVDLGFTYKRAKQDGEVTEDNALAEARVTWPEADSKWGTFAGGSVEKDRFKDFDERVRLNVGRTYDFEDTKETFLQGRLGVGAVRDFGGEEDEWSPEGVLAIDYRHELSNASKVTASSEVYPILDDLGEFRSITRAAWETKLADESPWIFKVGLEHEYDSKADDDVKKTDWGYFASLGFTF